MDEHHCGSMGKVSWVEWEGGGENGMEHYDSPVDPEMARESTFE